MPGGDSQGGWEVASAGACCNHSQGEAELCEYAGEKSKGGCQAGGSWNPRGDLEDLCIFTISWAYIRWWCPRHQGQAGQPAVKVQSTKLSSLGYTDQSPIIKPVYVGHYNNYKSPCICSVQFGTFYLHIFFTHFSSSFLFFTSLHLILIHFTSS